MPTIRADDGVKLHYEEAGEGLPLVFVHEFAGNHRSFEAQMRFFSRRYRCIAYNARGYPPSDVPESADHYHQDRARADILAVLDGLDIDQAHVVGVSMGAFATLHFGLHHPERARSLVVCGVGYGSPKDVHEQFRREALAMSERILEHGMNKIGDTYCFGPARVQQLTKDPRGHAEFVAMFKEHSALGSANTMRGVQGNRPSLYDLEDALRALTVPTLLISGDEDEPALDASLYLKRTIPSAGLAFVPKTGHAVNTEEPDAFNRLVSDFLHQVEAGRWQPRDPRSVSERILRND